MGNQGTAWRIKGKGRGRGLSHKNPIIAQRIAGFEGRAWDPHYLGYFDCFNQGRYYEAHDVLEAIWLPSRKGPKDHFYKGMIQLAGAFVHFQKSRMRPAGALLRLARENLIRYAPHYDGVVVADILCLIEDWLGSLDNRKAGENPFHSRPAPLLAVPVP